MCNYVYNYVYITYSIVIVIVNYFCYYYNYCYFLVVIYIYISLYIFGNEDDKEWWIPQKMFYRSWIFCTFMGVFGYDTYAPIIHFVARSFGT